MSISVGIIAHNEEKNIARILEAILGQSIAVKEIIVVSSGSTDKTNEIVRKYAKKHKSITLMTQEKRLGKASAINEFLKRASSEILVLESADTTPKNDAIEKIVRRFSDKRVGIVASRPIPANCGGILGHIVNLQWELHHQISLQKPKFGELVGFRNLVESVPKTAVDEEQIAALIQRLGYKAKYASDAIVYNHGPENLRDFLRQRRRIFCGHLELKKDFDYKPASLDNKAIVTGLWKTLKVKDSPYVALAVILEAVGRALGLFDYCTNKEKHYIWEVAKSTK